MSFWFIRRSVRRFLRTFAIVILVLLFALAGFQELLIRIERSNNQAYPWDKNRIGQEVNKSEPVLPQVLPITKKPKTDEFEILGDDWTLPVKMPQGLTYKGSPKIILSLDGQFNQQNLNGCPDWNCQIIHGEGNLQKADAIISSGSRIPGRNPSQYLVFMTQESPLHFDVSPSSKFNLTMGYRRDADLPCPYGYTIRRNVPLDNYKFAPETLRRKTKPVAWFVSNCHSSSGRENYVMKLQSHINVDVFGACGKMTCPKSGKCMEMLKKEYRFYLALENSVCKDYITEKLWSQGFSDVIPIVLKRDLIAPYVPPNSFLAVDDFASPKAMAEFLHFLMRNDTAYQEFFSWKKDYEIVFLNGLTHDIKERPWGFCRLCHMLWQEPRPEKSYDNLREWWVDDAKCNRDFVSKYL